jgi:hypothetical protein
MKRSLGPAPAGRPIPEYRTDVVVAVGNYVRLNMDRFTDNALDRKGPGVDLGTDPVDDNAPSAVICVDRFLFHPSIVANASGSITPRTAI